MSQQTLDTTNDAAVIRTTLVRDKRVIMPSPMVIGLAMLSGAGFLYLLLLFEIIPVQAVDGHVMTVVLAAIGVVCAIYGWVRVVSGQRN